MKAEIKLGVYLCYTSIYTSIGTEKYIQLYFKDLNKLFKKSIER